MPSNVHEELRAKAKEYVVASGSIVQKPNRLYIPIDKAAAVMSLDPTWEPGMPLSKMAYGCQVTYGAPGSEIRFEYET